MGRAEGWDRDRRGGEGRGRGQEGDVLVSGLTSMWVKWRSLSH